MAPPTANRQLTTPRKRVRKSADLRGAADGYFFPNEVVRMLRLEQLDYRQLRRLFRLVAISRGEIAQRKWARFTFQDLAAIRAALLALGGVDAILSKRRLPLKRLERVCEKLRTAYGLQDPLTQARIRWDGSEVIVQLLGARFEPDSGQLLLDLSTRLGRHLDEANAGPGERRVLGARVTRETQIVTRHGRRQVRAFAENEPSACLRLGNSR